MLKSPQSTIVGFGQNLPGHDELFVSRQQKPAIHRHHAACHVARGVGRQQQDGAVEIGFGADAALRNSFGQFLARRGRPEIMVHLGIDIARRQRIDPDAVAGPFGSRPGMGRDRICNRKVGTRRTYCEAE